MSFRPAVVCLVLLTGCLAPVGAYGRTADDGSLVLSASVLSFDGKRKLVADDLKALRDSAKIVYLGKFSATAPAVANIVDLPTPPDGAAAAPSVADAAVKPASGVDAASISKGLGLK